MRLIWKNAELVDEREGYLTIYDSALMYGDVAFEMTRTFNGQIFKLTEHFERLRKSCEYLEIKIPYQWSYLRGVYEDMIEVNRKEWRDDDEIRGLINVSRGILPMYAQAGMGDAGTQVIIANFPLRNILKDQSWVYTWGVDCLVPSQRAIPQDLLDPKIKSRSRQHYQMANLEVARCEPTSWALLLDPDGFVAEGTGSNFFIVKDGKVYTPEGRNCLRGISREFIFELCYMGVIDCFEKNITLYDVYEADEAFFTNTPFAIVPVKSVNKHPIKRGEITKKLTDLWVQTVGCDFVKQARRWDGENEWEARKMMQT